MVNWTLKNEARRPPRGILRDQNNREDPEDVASSRDPSRREPIGPDDDDDDNDSWWS